MKYRELIAYGIVGCISTADSMFWFWFFLSPIGLPYMVANAFGWFVDVWITFVLNKFFVFKSKDIKLFWKEARKFISARLTSGILDMLLLWTLIEVLNFDEILGKCIVIVIIIAVNYVTAKLFVFRTKGREHHESDSN